MNLLRSFSIYTIGSAAAGAIPLALLPVLTRHLSEAEYGVVGTLTALIAFLTPPVAWGVIPALSVEYFKLEPDRFREYLSSVLVIPGIALAALLLLAAPAAGFIADLLRVPALWFWSVPVFAALSILPQVFSAILRVRDEAAAWAAFEIFNAVAGLVLAIVLVVLLGLHWQGRMYAVAASSAIATLVAFWWLRKRSYLVARFDRAAFKDALRFGSGVVPHDLSNQAIRIVDRLFLVGMIGLAGAGQYAVAAQVASVMLVLLAAFNRAWAPYLFSRLKAGGVEEKRSIVRASYAVIGCAFVFFVAFNLAVPLAYRIFVDPKFHASMPFVLWLTLGYFFMAVYLTYVDYIFYVKKTYVLSGITVFNLCCNLLLNYLFIGKFGAIGAAFAFACTMFVVMVLAFVLSNLLHPMPWLYWIRRST